jgi:hypothetical protein
LHDILFWKYFDTLACLIGIADQAKTAFFAVIAVGATDFNSTVKATSAQ